MGPQGVSTPPACLQARSVLQQDSLMRGVLLGAQGRPLSKNLFQMCFLTLGNLSHELYYFFGTSQMWVLVFCAVVQVTYEIGPLTPAWTEETGPFLRVARVESRLEGRRRQPLRLEDAKRVEEEGYRGR